jgi:hypothetical protein
MARVVIAAILAAVVLMAWGMVFWAVSPLPYVVFHPLPNGDALAGTLKENIPESGVYFYPFQDPSVRGEAAEALMAKHRQGPLVQVFYRKDGVDPLSPETYALGFANFFFSALIAGGLLLMAAVNLASYGSRAAFVFLVGLFATVSIHLATPIWFHLPWPYFLLMAAYHTVGWLLAGLVIAAVVRPAKA